MSGPDTFIRQALRVMVEHEASDLFLTPDNPPSLKINGMTRPLGEGLLDPDTTRDAVYSLMTETQIRDFEATWELNFAIEPEGIGRFRVNVFRQRGAVAAVIRYLRAKVPDLQALNMPDSLYAQIKKLRGLVLVVGAAGSGKSTTIAAMLEHRNRHDHGHILTLEDPIEYRLRHANCVINQREIGTDAKSFEQALGNALREAPDVLFIGEIRSYETMKLALRYADTGVLVVSTLHANNADQAVERIINFFPETARTQVLADLAMVLQSIISQRLVRGLNGKRYPAVEVMLNTGYIADLIKQGKLHELKGAMKNSAETGMRAFDQSLYELHRDGLISTEEALRQADSRTDLGLRIKMGLESGPEMLNDLADLGGRPLG